MEPSEYRAIYTVEDRHWWYAGMARISRTLLTAAYPDRRDLRILDAGCGTGGALDFLAHFGAVTGSDISPLALAYSRARGHAALNQASVTALPYAAASFDLVTSFDVLYHRAVGDPRLALGEFRRVLSPGGRVREFVLTKRVSFSLRGAGGEIWLPLDQIVVLRTYTYDDTERLAREIQEQRLLVEMQTDAVAQLMRRRAGRSRRCR